MKNLLICLLLSLLPLGVLGQVTIAPTNLFIDSNARFGTYMVINGSNQSQEISVDFLFGYISSNDDGNRVFITDDNERESQYSVAEYIRAFPRNFTLAPGQRQVVRLRLNAPNDIADGTYWARIKTSSSPETPPIELQSNEAVSARVGIKVEQVTGLFYKKGSVNTGIVINDINSQFNEDNDLLILTTDLQRTGNSPFLGSVTTTITDSNGQEVKRSFLSTSVYFDDLYSQEFQISDLAPGTYTVNVTFETSRNDIAPQDMIQMEPVSDTTTFTIR
jgi:hypothetical protein